MLIYYLQSFYFNGAISFGTGVLLFGTPILILLDYEFQHALAYLLPVSILINVIQIKDNFIKVEFSFIKNLYLLVVLSFFTLYFIKIDLTDLSHFVGLFLIFIALKEKIGLLKRAIKSVLNYEYIYLIFFGFNSWVDKFRWSTTFCSNF